VGFENEEFIFTGIANVVKFCLFVLCGSRMFQPAPMFAYYLRKINQLKDGERFYRLTTSDFQLFNPNTGTSPIFRTKSDALLTKKVYLRYPVLVNEKTATNPWGYKGVVMFMMNTDSRLFKTAPNEGCIPLYEGKLFWHFEHRFGSYDLVGTAKGKGGRGLPDMPIGNLENPDYIIKPQYWVIEKEAQNRLPNFWKRKWLIAYRKVTSAKLERTTVCTILPFAGVGDSANVITLDVENTELISCFLANMNSIVFDYIMRQKLGGTNLNFYVLEQLPVLPPSTYTLTDIEYIAPRVLELVYTAYDLRPFAEDMGYHDEPFRWDEERRALLRAELDAYYARLYGLTRDELRYILDPQDVYGSHFPGETFRVLKEKEIKLYGEYRTRRLVLDAWDRLEGVEPARIERPVVLEQPAPVKEVYAPPTKEKPTHVVKERATQADAEQPPAVQTSFSDFGLYKCGACGKMVMGFDRENHVSEAHKRKGVEWGKVK